MHELIPFPLAVGDLGTRLEPTIIFVGCLSAASTYLQHHSPST